MVDELLGLTYSLHHNPNCPQPYLVRLPRGCLDHKPYTETRDFLGFGKTPSIAATNALRSRAEIERLTQGDVR